MSELLASPPLLEAVCEFRFTGAEAWDWTIPGRLYEHIRGDFPQTEQVATNLVSLEVGQGTPAGAQVRAGVGPGLVRMWQGNRTALVQVGPHLLTVNQLLPYPGWLTFANIIKKVYLAYANVDPQATLDRIGLRYINRIPVPATTSMRIGDLITIDPPLPRAIERPLASFFQRYELLQDDPRGVLVHQTALQRLSEDETVIILDLDYVVTLSPPVLEKDLSPLLDAVHARVEDVFFASLAPGLLDRMRGGTIPI